MIGVISLSDLLTFLVLRQVGHMKCSKVLEETAEDVLSDVESTSSTGDLTEQNQPEPTIQSDSLLLDEQCQLTTSSSDSTGTSSSSINSTKILLSGATTATNATNNAQTLIAPLK